MKRSYEKKDDKKLPRTPIKPTPTKPKANEQKLTPAEVWANAAKLMSKNTESPKKEEKPKTYDFSDLEERAKQYTKETRNEILNAIDNSRIYSLHQKPTSEKQLPAHFPSFFPTKRLVNFDGRDIYSKLECDTLFYIFYNDKNTIRQYYAAKMLKHYSWRFHIKYMTWFQRLEEPKIITEDYEQGVFVFFDHETTWANRKKKDFTFEYKFLEDIEM